MLNDKHIKRYGIYKWSTIGFNGEITTVGQPEFLGDFDSLEKARNHVWENYKGMMNQEGMNYINIVDGVGGGGGVTVSRFSIV